MKKGRRQEQVVGWYAPVGYWGNGDCGHVVAGWEGASAMMRTGQVRVGVGGWGVR